MPCPTNDGRTAEDLYNQRLTGITAAMQESARSHGCRFHRAWYTEDGSRFVAIAEWESAAGANAFFKEWNIEDEPGEVAFRLLGDAGLVPLP